MLYSLIEVELGKSRLAANVNQLARAVNAGTLRVSPQVEKDIETACRREIQTMRALLMVALGLRLEGNT